MDEREDGDRKIGEVMAMGGEGMRGIAWLRCVHGG